MERSKNKVNNNLIAVARKVYKYIDRSLFSIILDILNCSKKYNITYQEYLDNEFYNMNELQRESFISEAFNNSLIKKYNNVKYKEVFDNRHEFNQTFEKFIKRKYILLNDKNYNEFIDFIVNKSKIVAKPLYKNCGDSVEIFRINARTDRKKLYNKLLKRNLLIVEDFITQDKKLNKIYESSINSFMLTTFLCDNGDVIVLNRILSIGCDELVNSFNNGGLYVLLDKEGAVIYPAIYNNKLCKAHPKSNFDLVNCKFDNIKELAVFVKRLAKNIPGVRYITWNVTYNNKEIVLIDADFSPKVINIKPSLIREFVGFKKEYERIMGKGEEM